MKLMKRALGITVIVASPLVAASVWAQSPGAAPRLGAPTTPAAPPAAGVAAGASGANSQAPGDSYSGGSTGSASTVPTLGEAELEKQRLKIWESLAMKEARAYVEEYGRRSKQFTTADAEQYLAKLRQMSPTEMQKWLERFASRQARNARSAAVAKAARQTAVEQAVARLQAVQQSYEAFNQGQTEGALVAREKLANQKQFTDELGAAKASERANQLAGLYAENFSWIYIPTPFKAQQMASASVPGDLPPGDPRNFLKGDAPIAGEAAAAFGLGSPAAVDAAAAGNGVP